VLNLAFECIYAPTGNLFRAAPTKTAMQPSDLRVSQASLQRSAARVMEERRSVDAAWVQKRYESSRVHIFDLSLNRTVEGLISV
jgi:hypothetical protein